MRRKGRALPTARSGLDRESGEQLQYVGLQLVTSPGTGLVAQCASLLRGHRATDAAQLVVTGRTLCVGTKLGVFPFGSSEGPE